MKITIKSSTKFCHYTTIDNARKILNNERIFLSKFNCMNDKSECNLHRNEEDLLYSVSFCHSDARSIPLFYLYSGIDGKGCKIQLTDSKIRKLIANCEVYPVNKSLSCLKKPLSKDDYDIYYNWIYYIADDGYTEYKGKEFRRYSCFDDAIKQNQDDPYSFYFIKNPVWKYEKEFRIIIKTKIKLPYNKLALRFPVSENDRSISIMCAPEINNTEYNEIVNEFKDYGITNIEKYSDDRIQIEMCLKKRNN